MKVQLLLLVLAIINFTHGGIVPASTTLVRSASTIAHSPSFAYSQPYAPVAFTYSAPVSYSNALAPALYSQPLLTSAHYASPLFVNRPVYAQQPIFAQYPGLIAQSPVVAQYPFNLIPVNGQNPGAIQGPSQIPTQGGSPAIEAPDDSPQPSQPPAQPPQQSPIFGGGSSGTTVDDDTVSIEAA